MSVPASAMKPRKVVHEIVAVIGADISSGCGAGVEPWPIARIDAMPGERPPGAGSSCEIDVDRRIGRRRRARDAAGMIDTPSAPARAAAAVGCVAARGDAPVDRARRSPYGFPAKRRK